MLGKLLQHDQHSTSIYGQADATWVRSAQQPNRAVLPRPEHNAQTFPKRCSGR
jgi:hypothetical protein